MRTNDPNIAEDRRVKRTRRAVEGAGAQIQGNGGARGSHEVRVQHGQIASAR